MNRIVAAALLSFVAAGHALAADMEPPMPPPGPPAPPPYYAPVPVPPIYNWTGFYLGANAGYGFGNSNWTAAGTSIGSFNTSGALVGGTIGGNFQAGPAVFGIEGDADWSNLTGTNNSALCGVGCQTQSNFLGTVRGRVGYGLDRVLLYGTGGAAFGNVQAGFSGGPFSSTNAVGWTAGGGVEFAITPRLTAKVEYLYVNLGTGQCTTACGGTAINVKLNENLVRLGVNYKF